MRFTTKDLKSSDWEIYMYMCNYKGIVVTSLIEANAKFRMNIEEGVNDK